MNIKKQLLRSIAYLVIIVNCFLFVISCGKKLDPDPLPLTVKQNLALLQTDPQFVMYFNFKKMRDTKFWEQFLSDSVFSAERNFGGFLNLINQAAGVSISNGIDEMYFSNSWIGDNAIVVKGTFDRKRVNDYVSADTLYTKIDYPNGITVYKQVDANLNFYFKDDFTLCASNYLKQIENTFTVTDTSTAGLLTNINLMKEIEQIKHKDNLWMISNQKLFIRGIFENFSDMNKKKSSVLPGGEPGDSLSLSDTTQNDNMNELFSIYKKINSVAFSLKMTNDIEIIMQNECEDLNSATELKNRMEAVIALAKLSTTLSGKKPPPAIKMLDKVETEVYDNTVILEAKLNENDIKELRQQKIF
ncbi:MAG TPA: hypothetical protein VG961_09845 [Ignavibacteria bacterium]|nr:hypothetical protein [Ignavibacteria bacterium]